MWHISVTGLTDIWQIFATDRFMTHIWHISDSFLTVFCNWQFSDRFQTDFWHIFGIGGTYIVSEYRKFPFEKAGLIGMVGHGLRCRIQMGCGQIDGWMNGRANLEDFLQLAVKLQSALARRESGLAYFCLTLILLAPSPCFLGEVFLPPSHAQLQLPSWKETTPSHPRLTANMHYTVG